MHFRVEKFVPGLKVSDEAAGFVSVPVGPAGTGTGRNLVHGMQRLAQLGRGLTLLCGGS